MPLSPKTRCSTKTSTKQRLKTRGGAMMNRPKEQLQLLPALSDLKSKSPRVSPLFPKNKRRAITKFFSRIGRKVHSVMPSPHDASPSLYYANCPKKKKSAFKPRERTKKKSKSARKYKRRHLSKRRTGKTVKARKKIRGLAGIPPVKRSSKAKNNIGFPSWVQGSADSYLREQNSRPVDVDDSENIKLFAEGKMSFAYPADSMLSAIERPWSPRKNPRCSLSRSRTPTKSSRVTKRSVQNSYDRAIWKQVDILEQEMSQYPMSMEEQIGTSLRYHLELINHNQELDLGNSIDVFRWTIDKYRELVNGISLQLANMILHKQSHAESNKKELKKVKLTIQDKNTLISSLVKKQMLDAKELSRLYNSLMTKSKEKLAEDVTPEIDENSLLTLNEGCGEKSDSLKERLRSRESELRKLKFNYVNLKGKFDAMESSNMHQCPTNKFGQGETIVECCAEAQNLNKKFQAKVLRKMIHLVKLDKIGPSTAKTSASSLQGRFEESILEAKELSRWSEMLKSELRKLHTLCDNRTTIQVSDSIILRDTISELLESEGIINKCLLALNNSCSVHQLQNLTESRKLNKTTNDIEDVFCNNSKEDERSQIADDQINVDESEWKVAVQVGFNTKPGKLELVSEEKNRNVNRHKSKTMTKNKQGQQRSVKNNHKIIKLENETQSMPAGETKTSPRHLQNYDRKRSSTISAIDIQVFRRENIHCRKYLGLESSRDWDSSSTQLEPNFNHNKTLRKSQTSTTVEKVKGNSLTEKNTGHNHTESLEPVMSCSVSGNSGPQHLELEPVYTIPEHRIIYQRIRAKSICARLLSPNLFSRDFRSSESYPWDDRLNLMATTLKPSSTHETREIIEKLNSPVFHLSLPRTEKCEKILNPLDEVRAVQGSNSITNELNSALINETTLKAKEERTNLVTPESAAEVVNQSVEKTNDICLQSKAKSKLSSNTESISDDWWTKQDKFKAQYMKKKVRAKNNKVGFAKTPKKPSDSSKASVGDHKLRKRRMTPYVGNMSSEIQFSSKLCPKNKRND